MTRRLLIAATLYAVGSVVLAAVSQGLDSRAARHTGLLRTVESDAGEPVSARTQTIALDFLEETLDAPRRNFGVRWKGFWYVPENMSVDLGVGGDDRVLLNIDGETVLEHDVTRGLRPGRRRMALDQGLHDVTVDFAQYGGLYSLRVLWAPAGHALRPFPPPLIFPVRPEAATIAQTLRAVSLRRLARAFWVGVPILLLLAVVVRHAVKALTLLITSPAASVPVPRATRGTVLLVSLALLIAAFARFWGLSFGLPHTLVRPDEQFLIDMAHRFLSGQTNPGFYDYPPLFAYGLTILCLPYYAWGFVNGVFGSTADLVASWTSEWRPFYLLSRLLSATVGTATVLVVYRMALRLFDRDTALISAFLMAFAYLHARDSHFGTVDVSVTFMILLSLQFLVRAHLHDGRRELIWAGALGGLAMATKYNAALLVVPLAVSHFAYVVRRPPGTRLGALINPRLAYFSVPFGLAFLAAAPYSVIEFERFLSAMQAVQEALRTGAGRIDVGYGWSYHLGTSLRHGLGIPMLVAAGMGVVVAARRDLATTLVLCAFPAAYYCVAGRYQQAFVRYMVPVVPFACLLAACAIVWAARRLSVSWSGARPAVAMVLLTTVVIWPSAANLFRFDQLLGRIDSRVLAAEWIREHAAEGSSIWQTGGRYASVQFDPTDHYVTWRDPPRTEPPSAGDRQPGQPDWIIVQRSPLSGNPDASLTTLLTERYALTELIRGSGALDSDNVFDLQDAFYVSYAGFQNAERPGPDILIYRRR